MKTIKVRPPKQFPCVAKSIMEKIIYGKSENEFFAEKRDKEECEKWGIPDLEHTYPDDFIDKGQEETCPEDDTERYK